MRPIKLLVISWFIFSLPNLLYAQCKSEIRVKSSPSEKGLHTGKIELKFSDHDFGSYTFQVFRISNEPKLILSKKLENIDQLVAFENLEAGLFIVKIEWGKGCTKQVGGLDGILITEKKK
jgi:hypothetical protein